MTLTEVLARLEGVRRCAGGYVARCVAHADRNASLSIRETENGRVLFHCFAGCEYSAIRDALGGRPWTRTLGLPGSGSRSPALDDAKRTEIARRIWRESKPATGTPVERYLRLGRGITIPPPPSIRFKTGRHGPSQTGPWAIMVAAVQNVAGGIVAIHRTYLTNDGHKAPVDPVKMACGRFAGGAVRLAPAAETLCLCEGIETGLSIMQAADLAVWIALGTSNLGCVELPEITCEVIIAADGDDPGEQAAQAAAQRFLREGREVRIARPTGAGDFNEMRL